MQSDAVDSVLELFEPFQLQIFKSKSGIIIELQTYLLIMFLFIHVKSLKI